MSPVNKTDAPPAKGVGGLLGCLFGRGEHEIPGSDAHSRAVSRSTLKLSDIQGFILLGYRMPMVRHFLLSVGVPTEARKMLGRLVSADESDVPQITTAENWHVGFAPGPEDNLTEARPASPTIAGIWVLPGRD